MSKIKYKYKLLTKDELIISLDRLSRFKHPDCVYPRVFRDIIHKCCLEPNFSDKEIDSFPAEDIAQFCSEIWNKSVFELYGHNRFDNDCDKVLKYLSTSVFNVCDINTQCMMSQCLNFASLLSELSLCNIPLNLLFLKFVYNELKTGSEISDSLLNTIREKHALLYPVKKLVIVEGITEDILLPVFASKLHNSFEKSGIFVLSAGGKTKIPVLYNSLKSSLKIPVILMFDNDAKEICDTFQKSVLTKDKLIINKKGEFEDLLSLNLIKRTINNFYYNSEKISLDELRLNFSMCKNLEDYFKSRNIGEFKKAHFSKLLSENVKYDSDISPDIHALIDEIVAF